MLDSNTNDTYDFKIISYFQNQYDSEYFYLRNQYGATYDGNKFLENQLYFRGFDNLDKSVGEKHNFLLAIKAQDIKYPQNFLEVVVNFEVEECQLPQNQ